jgi:hypothetical protein
MIKCLQTLALCVALFFPATGLAQESTGNPAAKAMLERGLAARKQQKLDLAVEAFRKAIELDPNYVAAHTEFIGALRSLHRQQGAEDGAPAKIDAIYQAWIDANPRQAAYHWGLGEGSYTREPLRAERSCLKAVELDPKFAKAWHTLSLLAEMKGDNKASREYLRRATEANPKDAGYLFYYSRRVIETDPVEGQKLALEVVKRFPATERAAQSLYWLGVDSEKPAEKIAYLERLRREFRPDRYSWSSSGMSSLFNAYADTDPAQAIALGRDMMVLMPKDTSWAALVSFEETLQKARVLISEKKAAEALALLNSAKPPLKSSPDRIALLKAEAEAATGKVQRAYDRLAPSVATRPAEGTYRALLKYGSQLHRSAAGIEADLAARRDKIATPATAFSLPTYDGKTASLTDFRGKIVLLNFWYPG